MVTDRLYYDDPYAAEATATVTQVEPRGGSVAVVSLDRTIFYPEGGGQPADQGDIVTATGSIKVTTVRGQGADILHEGKMVGTVEEGQDAKLSLKWSRRIKYMRLHSAGHLIHDVLVDLQPQLVAIRGKHGDKAFLEYDGEVDAWVQDALPHKVNEMVREDLPVRTWETTYEELQELLEAVPKNLPRDKQLRVLRIGAYTPMPDGGVQVESTAEIGEVVIHHVNVANGRSTIRYGVSGSGKERQASASLA
jgi:Ser-tRNA(Ala) deacylase AlaX